MATDFTYGGKQILSSGPFKPSGKDIPNDARTRVESYADIASIPNPYVGLKITVKIDETNDNKMTDYIVKSLKANSMGVADSLIDEVVRYVDYLGVSSSEDLSNITSTVNLNSEKINELNSQMDTKANTTDVNSKIWNMSNMGQDVKESMTGGSVAIIGRDMVLTENIVDRQITPYKTNFFNIDTLFDYSKAKDNFSIHIDSGIEVGFNGHIAFDFTPVIPGNNYYLYGRGAGVHLYYYDSSKGFIQYAGGGFGSNGSVLSIPSNVYYIRIVSNDMDKYKYTLNEGTTLKEYASPKINNDYIDSEKLIIKGENVKDLPAKNCEFFTVVKQELGGYTLKAVVNPAIGEIYTNYAGRTMWDMIELRGNSVYTINFEHYVYYYNSNQQYVLDLKVLDSRRAGTYTLPSKNEIEQYDVKYIRFCSLTDDEQTIKSQWCSFTPYGIENTGCTYLKEDYIKLPNLKDSWYKGKKIVSFGDSITEGNKWQPLVCNYFQATSIVRGIGGTTVCNVGADQHLCGDTRISTIPEDADVIILGGGANDWASGFDLGEPGKGTFRDTVFAEAYELMIKKIVERCPNARIIALSLIGGRGRYTDQNDISEAPNSKELVINDYSEMVKKVCSYHGIPCIDIHAEAGINVFNHTTYIQDIVHPNDLGGERIANAVINGMKRFEPIIF